MVEETKQEEAPVIEEKPAFIDEAAKIADRLEKANLQALEILKKQEHLAAVNLLSGKSSAGQPSLPVETEEEKWRREAKIRYAGTGMDPT